MHNQSRRVLILDFDSETLITLQRMLENAGIDTTVTWDEKEARRLLKKRPPDLMIIGDHPPELDAKTILHDFNFQDSCSRLVLRGDVQERDFDYFHRLGALGVVARRDLDEILDVVRSALAAIPFKAPSARFGPARARGYVAAS